MGRVIGEEQIIPELRYSPCEGGMLVHPTELILIRGGLKGGGEATPLLVLSFEEGIYT